MTGRLIRLMAIFMLLLGAGETACAATSSTTGRVVRVAFCPERGIYERMEDGTISGVGPDLIKRVAARLHWRVEWQQVSSSEGLKGLESDELDVLGAITKTPERAKMFHYVRTPMGTRRLSLYVLKSSPFERIDKAMDGCVIGAVEQVPFPIGTFVHRHIADKFAALSIHGKGVLLIFIGGVEHPHRKQRVLRFGIVEGDRAAAFGHRAIARDRLAECRGGRRAHPFVDAVGTLF